MELTGYLAVARRWWWTLLVATWVAGMSGYVVASQIPPTYEAETQLLVGPYNTDRETLQAAGDLVQTYSQLVTTTPLLESAIAEAGATMTPTDLALASRVTANDITRFLTIRVQDTSPEMAARLANALADEIITARGRWDESSRGPDPARRLRRGPDRAGCAPEVAHRRPRGPRRPDRGDGPGHAASNT